MSKFLHSILLISTVIGFVACDNDSSQKNQENQTSSAIEKKITELTVINDIYPDQTASGSFLAGQFAQAHFDWSNAADYFATVRELDPSVPYMDTRIMALSMGAGHYEQAIAIAKKIILSKTNEDKSLAIMLSALEPFKKGDYNATLNILNQAKNDGLGSAVIPLFRAWANAGLGKTDVTNIINKNAISYQAVIIAAHNKDKKTLNEISKKIDFLQIPVAINTLEEIANIFAINGQTDAARKILTALRDDFAEKREIYNNKLNDLNNSKISEFKSATVNYTPQQSFAIALINVSQMLDNNYQDSARVFAHMAAFLQPDDNEPLALLAQIASDSQQYDEAISYLQRINTNDDKEKTAQLKRQIAFLLEQSEKIDEAIRILQDLSDNYNNVDAQIQIGDIYRAKSQFQLSLDAYNNAFKMLNNNVPRKYWDLLFSRGIIHEQLKNWDMAEKDLKSALNYEPDQPYILNYLGYSWADQGKNLDKAAEMIEKAARIKPTDGAIIDSLGWVYFRMGNYDRAVKTLEKAIELAPTESEINDHLGDAYWRVGRKSEAIFQWRRAISFTTEQDLITKITTKLENGLPPLSSSPSTAKLTSR